MNSKYDLLERTAVFGENIIRFCNSLPKTVITIPLINQLVKAGTSVGANYTEADNAESKKDFKHKIGICRKESKETGFFLRMINTAIPEKSNEVEKLLKEANELNLIFNAINHKTHLD
jgi:four helix bundle protein